MNGEWRMVTVGEMLAFARGKHLVTDTWTSTGSPDGSNCNICTFSDGSKIAVAGWYEKYNTESGETVGANCWVCPAPAPR